MDTTKPSGIAFERVDLVSCSIGNINKKNELHYCLKLAKLTRVLSDDKKRLGVLFGFDLMGGIDNPPFKFTCSFFAHYSQEENANMSWDEFLNVIALSHIIPYLREFLSNMTNRMPIPVLLLPPINAYLLIEEYEKLTAKPVAETPEPPKV